MAQKGIALILMLLLVLGDSLAFAGGAPGEGETAAGGEDEEVSVIVIAAAVLVVGAVLLWILMRSDGEAEAPEEETSLGTDPGEALSLAPPKGEAGDVAASADRTQAAAFVPETEPVAETEEAREARRETVGSAP